MERCLSQGWPGGKEQKPTQLECRGICEMVSETRGRGRGGPHGSRRRARGLAWAHAPRLLGCFGRWLCRPTLQGPSPSHGPEADLGPTAPGGSDSGSPHSLGTRCFLTDLTLGGVLQVGTYRGESHRRPEVGSEGNPPRAEQLWGGGEAVRNGGHFQSKSLAWALANGHGPERPPSSPMAGPVLTGHWWGRMEHGCGL